MPSQVQPPYTGRGYLAATNSSQTVHLASIQLLRKQVEVHNSNENRIETFFTSSAEGPDTVNKEFSEIELHIAHYLIRSFRDSP